MTCVAALPTDCARGGGNCVLSPYSKLGGATPLVSEKSSQRHPVGAGQLPQCVQQSDTPGVKERDALQDSLLEVLSKLV